MRGLGQQQAATWCARHSCGSSRNSATRERLPILIPPWQTVSHPSVMLVCLRTCGFAGSRTRRRIDGDEPLQVVALP